MSRRLLATAMLTCHRVHDPVNDVVHTVCPDGHLPPA